MCISSYFGPSFYFFGLRTNNFNFFDDIFFFKYYLQKCYFWNIFSSKIFCLNIFLPKIFLVTIFDKYFYCENIFGLLLLIAHPLVPYLKPQPLLSPSSGIFEVKCDRRNETKRTYGPDGAMIVPFIITDKNIFIGKDFWQKYF